MDSKEITTIPWNSKVKLIFSDVDETIADNYAPAKAELIEQLIKVLKKGTYLFLISGSSLERIKSRLIDKIPESLRTQIVVAHCSGAEVWGFTPEGEIREKPYYSYYETSISDEQKKQWRKSIRDIINEFHLITHPPMPTQEFKKIAGNNPLAIMIEDRGPQITFEVVNGYHLAVAYPSLNLSIGSDLRLPIINYASSIFEKYNLPIKPHLAGMWAIDFALKGVNKTTAIKHMLGDDTFLSLTHLSREDLSNPESFEVWGDKFSRFGGTDLYMSQALPNKVRSVDFRLEEPKELPQDYNIIVWKGKKHLHDGLLEYLEGQKFDE